jgi:hypothetical protein
MLGSGAKLINIPVGGTSPSMQLSPFVYTLPCVGVRVCVKVKLLSTSFKEQGTDFGERQFPVNEEQR